MTADGRSRKFVRGGPACPSDERRRAVQGANSSPFGGSAAASAASVGVAHFQIGRLGARLGHRADLTRIAGALRPVTYGF